MDKLKQLQAKREELGSQYRAIVKDTTEWTPEITEKTDKIWAAYEANLAELETEKARVESDLQRETEMAGRLGKIDGYQDYSPPSGPSPLARLGRDNGELPGGGRGNGQVEEDRVHAFNAWVNMSGVRDVTNEQMEACQRLQFNPSAESIKFNIGQQNRFAQVRSLIRQTPGLDPEDKIAALSTGRFQNALSAVTGAAGGYTVPEGIINTLEINIVAFGGMLQAADIWRTDSGNEVPWSTADDTGNTGEIVAESSDQDGSTDPDFAAVIFGATGACDASCSVQRTLPFAIAVSPSPIARAVRAASRSVRAPAFSSGPIASVRTNATGPASISLTTRSR